MNAQGETATPVQPTGTNGAAKGPPGAQPSIARRGELLVELGKLDGDKPEVVADKPMDPDVGKLEAKKPEPSKVKVNDAAKEPDDDKIDPDTQKRLAKVQQAEKRSKEELAKLRADAKAEIEDMRRQIEREWAPKVEAAKKAESLRARAKHDADALIEALGFADDDLEPIAQALYLRSQKGAADPKARAAADKALKEREGRSELMQLRKVVEELQEARASEKNEREQQAAIEEFLDRIVRKVGDDAPTVKGMLAKDATKTRARLLKMARRLAAEDPDTTPDPSDVISGLEARRVARNERREGKRSKREAEILAKYGLDAKTLKPAAKGEGAKAAASNGESKAMKDSRSARDALLGLMPD